MIKSIPNIFDEADLDKILTKLINLGTFGVTELKIGKKVYSVNEVVGIIEEVKGLCEKVTRGEINMLSDKSIDEQLAKFGVTRDKISDSSAFGFREAMLLCVKFELKGYVAS